MPILSPESCSDLDHEVAQLVRLQTIMTADDYRSRYIKAVRRAIDVAYASHFRALIEFFHDGRPKGSHPSDLRYSEVTGEPPYRYTTYAARRLKDADRLVGHLSKLRRNHVSDWGSDDDWNFAWPMIQQLLRRPGIATMLPQAMTAVDEAGLTPQ